MLYFGDPELVEKTLHEDLNIIIKIVKIRQEQFLELLEYNKAFLNKQRSIESTIFINEELAVHNKFYHTMQNTHNQARAEEIQILERYNVNAAQDITFEAVLRLMARVIARILETNQNYLDKAQYYQQHTNLTDQFNKMKATLTRLLNNKEKIDLQQCTRLIINYAQQKAVHQLQKLKALIKTLQEGEIQKIPYIYKGTKPPEKQSIQQKQTQCQMKPLPMVKKTQVIEQKQSVPKVTKVSPKKSQKARLLDQIRKQQKRKKQKKNLVNKIFSTFYSTMDLSKKEFMEDMLQNNEKEQYDRIYHQMLSRNRFNQEQILAFEGQKDAFEEKVRLFKQMMEKQSQKIQQVLMIRKQPIEKKQNIHSDSTSKLQVIDEEARNPQKSETQNKDTKKSFILRQKVPSPKFYKETEITQFRLTQQNFNHIKFDNNQEVFLRSNRNRLPIIGKPFSGTLESQHRYNNHLSSNSQKKDINGQNSQICPTGNSMTRTKQSAQPRKNILMKHIEVGVQNMIKQKNIKGQNYSLNEKNHQSGGSNNTTLMELTFYGSRKKNYVLNDKKNNYAF